MGLFGFSKKDEKKEVKNVCPLCGGKSGLFNSVVLNDGTSICETCAAKLRTKYPIESREKLDAFGNVVYQSNGAVKTYIYDALNELSLDEVKAAIEEQDAAAFKAASTLGSGFSATFTVGENIFRIAPKTMDVGMFRAKKLKDALVMEGAAHTGEFTKDDAVILVHDGVQIPITILEAHTKDAGGFETELRANLSRKVRAGKSGWLIVDYNGLISAGDIIGKA